MELKTLFKRESVADSLSIRSIQIPPNQNNLIVAQALFRSKSLTLAGWRTGSKGIFVGLKMAK
jgi:hypothetical protein